MATTLDSYWPFDSGDGANVTEAQWSDMARLWRPTGVVKGVLNDFEVTADAGGMYVNVNTGEIWIEGHYGKSTSSKELAISAADSSNPRYDRVVGRLDWTNNRIEVDILTGTAAASPTKPALTQSTSKWEVSLANVYVGTGVTNIAGTAVTDERAYSAAASQQVNGRLTLASGSAVPNFEISGSANVYFTPYKGNQITLPTSSGGDEVINFAEVSYDGSGLDEYRNYDVFFYNNSGVSALSLNGWAQSTATGTASAAGTVITVATTYANVGDPISVVGTATAEIVTITAINGGTSIVTTALANTYVNPTINWNERGTALALSSGRYVDPNFATRLYVGGVRTDENGKMNDFGLGGNNLAAGTVTAKRCVFNQYNKVARKVLVYDDTDSWTYNSTTVHSWNGSDINRVEILTGKDSLIDMDVYGYVTNASVASGFVGLGINRADDKDNDVWNIGSQAGSNTNAKFLEIVDDEGYRFLQLVEWCQAAASVTFWGDITGLVQTGLVGKVWI